MSTITPTKRLRALDWDKDKPFLVRQSVKVPAVFHPDGSLKRPQKFNWYRVHLKGGMFRKPVADPAEPRKDAGNCYHCEMPVYVSKGQIINYAINGKTGHKLPTHKLCRKPKKW